MADMLIDVFVSLKEKFELVALSFFVKNTEFARPILDFLHSIFNGFFNLFLFVTVLISLLFLIMCIYNSFHKKSSECFLDYTPKITVQIPTYNELVALRCAKSCLNFDYPNEKYEVLIGDDSNNASVSAKLAEFAEKHKSVKIIKRDKNTGFKPGNLNNMLKHSSGDIIVIFDSDFVPKNDFLKRIVQPFAFNENIAAVQAKWTFINQNQNLVSILASTILHVYHYITLPFIKSFRGKSFLCGSAEAVRKDILIKLGGWDSGNLTEDIEYSIRLLNKGYTTFYLHDLTCDSEVPYYPKDLYKQQMRWAYGVVFSLKKHFKNTFFNSTTNLTDKLCVGIVVGGYFFAMSLFFLFLFGLLSLVTHTPEPINFSVFFYETTRNIFVTSGLLIASIIAMIQSKNTGKIIQMIVSSFSYGILTTYYVNKGIFKAIVGLPMHWYMLSKKGNSFTNSALQASFSKTMK